MNLRDAINTVEHVIVDERLNYDEVVKFLKEKSLENTPVILNVNGKRVAKNFVSSRELLAKYLGIDPRRIALELNKIDRKKADIRIKDFSELDCRKIKTNLFDLPILKYYPEDGGRYITAGIVIARRNDVFNASVHRMMLVNETSLAIRLVPPRHTYLMWKEAVESGEDLKVAIAIGTHPLFLLAAATRVEFGKEFDYASKLLGGLTLFKKGSLLVPDSEIVIFGRITSEKTEEGPFVDVTGTYDKVRLEPVLVVDEIFCKKDYLYYSITPGSREHQILMGIPYEPLILKFVSNVCKVRNVVMTPGSKHYFHCIVQIEKESEGDPKNAILAALSANPSMKGVIVVDDDIDIFEIGDVEYAIATRFQADRDLVVIKGVRGSSLDPSSGKLTAKWGIDATKTLGNGKFRRVTG